MTGEGNGADIGGIGRINEYPRSLLHTLQHYSYSARFLSKSL